jgi:hypothetical protein
MRTRLLAVVTTTALCGSALFALLVLGHLVLSVGSARLVRAVGLPCLRHHHHLI